MRSLKDKIVLITGATAGIGKACAYHFAQEGARIIITARRANILNEIAEDIRAKHNSDVYAVKLNVKDYDEVKYMINSLPDEWKAIDTLVNNAGMARGTKKIQEEDAEGWNEVIDTNIKGVLNVSREVIPGMIERKRGHVINIGSIAGRQAYSGGAVYCGTKHALQGITHSMRLDLLGTGVRVTTVDPGLVETDFSKVRFYGDEEKAASVYKGYIPLTGDDIAEAVIFCATRPDYANINELVIMPSAQASAYHVVKEE